MQEVTCNTCGKALDEYNWSDSWKKAARHQCKSCSKEYNDKSNKNRMYINGKYIPQTHPLYKPGNYKSLDDAWSHTEIEKTTDGEVYLVINPAWPDWVKLGKAAIATDRLSGYQTGSPYRDYILLCSVYVDNRHETEKELLTTFKKHATEYKGEWFKMSHGEAIDLLESRSHDGGIA